MQQKCDNTYLDLSSFMKIRLNMINYKAIVETIYYCLIYKKGQPKELLSVL